MHLLARIAGAVVNAQFTTIVRFSNTVLYFKERGYACTRGPRMLGNVCASVRSACRRTYQRGLSRCALGVGPLLTMVAYRRARLVLLTRPLYHAVLRKSRWKIAQTCARLFVQNATCASSDYMILYIYFKRACGGYISWLKREQLTKTNT